MSDIHTGIYIIGTCIDNDENNFIKGDLLELIQNFEGDVDIYDNFSPENIIGKCKNIFAIGEYLYGEIVIFENYDYYKCMVPCIGYNIPDNILKCIGLCPMNLDPLVPPLMGNTLYNVSSTRTSINPLKFNEYNLEVSVDGGGVYRLIDNEKIINSKSCPKLSKLMRDIPKTGTINIEIDKHINLDKLIEVHND